MCRLLQLLRRRRLSEALAAGLSRGATLLCLVVVHTPDGEQLRIDSRSVMALRASTGVEHHLAKGTKTILYLTGKNFGLVETPDEVVDRINHCKEPKQ